MEEDKNEEVNFWKEESFNRGDMATPLLEESSFATTFPTYREKYLQEVWSILQKALADYGIKADLDVMGGTMTVSTTKKTWDPYAIFKARDLIKMLARSMALPQAIKIMQDDMTCDIINISMSDSEKFAKRRQRLLGPNGATLKALELLTDCYIMVQGKTVIAMGSATKVVVVRKVVEDCMKNVHPIYNIKTLMIKRELSKNESLKDADWSKFLPKFRKAQPAGAKKKKKKFTKEAKEYNPFPVEQTPRKIDLELESGEYFLTEGQKDRVKAKAKEEAIQEKTTKKQHEKKQRYIAPEEKVKTKSKEPIGSVEATPVPSTAELSQNIVKNLKKRKDGAPTQSANAAPPDQFIRKKVKTTKK
eukprot:TRINITY_DN4418_c0_g1_i1.p1 TRINITY_DN4418_c0_g1~~TRINITY_DN4418_c0_g1_i1.p1  ORF type:complete len:368 (+),score=104.27 TRINITY_DN4418_c0_g1_i1:24-1106(+)